MASILQTSKKLTISQCVMLPVPQYNDFYPSYQSNQLGGWAINSIQAFYEERRIDYQDIYNIHGCNQSIIQIRVSNIISRKSSLHHHFPCPCTLTVPSTQCIIVFEESLWPNPTRGRGYMPYILYNMNFHNIRGLVVMINYVLPRTSGYRNLVTTSST